MALDISRIMLGRADGNTNFAQYTFPVTSGVTVTSGDFVYQDAAGRVTNSSIGTTRLVGMATSTVVGNAGGTNKVAVCTDPLMRYLLKNDNIATTFAATHVLTNFDLIGATGAQLVDTSSTGTSGQLLCVEYNPSIDPVATDTTYGIFTVAESVFFAGSGAQ